METSFIDFLIQYGKEGIFLVLFGYLFWDTRKEGKARDKEFYTQIEKSNEQLDNAIEVIQKFEKNFESINSKIDQLAVIIEKK
jgi:predicted deacetylase